MADIINHLWHELNRNSGAVIAVATVVLVGVTVVYAWVTHQMRLDAQKPRIAVYLGLKKELTVATPAAKYPAMYLYIENIGMGPAYDVNLVPSVDLALPDKRSLGEIEFIARGIRYLPPRQKRKLLLGHQLSRGKQMEDLMQDQLELTVTYKGIGNKEYKEPFCLDFGEYRSEYRQIVPEKAN